MKEAKNKDVFTYLLWGVIIQVVAGFMIPPLYRLITGPAADKATELVLTSAVYSIVLFVMFYRLKWCPLSPDYVRGKHWDVLFWTVVFTLGSIIPMAFLEEAMPELPNLVEDELTLLRQQFRLCNDMPLRSACGGDDIPRGDIAHAALCDEGQDMVADSHFGLSLRPDPYEPRPDAIRFRCRHLPRLDIQSYG